MNSSYSPGESNSVAVVPSPLSSINPQGYHPRSPVFSGFESDFGYEPPAKKRICLDQVALTQQVFDFPHGDFPLPCTDATPVASRRGTPSPFSSSPQACKFADFTTFQPSNLADQVLQQTCCGEDSPKAGGLANFPAANGAMQPFQQAQMGSQTIHAALDPGAATDYSMIVYHEPEEYYRARYETEGIRGPLKGRDNNHPAVKIIGPATYSGTVNVMLAHEDGTKHVSCFLDETKDRQKALTKKIDPQSNMIVEFEDLRIRRETKSKNYSKDGSSSRKADKARSARNDKTACLCFTATLQLSDREIKLTVLSKPIQLSAPPEGAELEWLVPEYGHVSGEERVVIKGTKMTCPKVTFTLLLPDGRMDLAGHVDKEQSHQNVLIVKTPRVPEEVKNYQDSNGCFKAEVRVSSGRAGTCSTPLPFIYIPNNLCHTCKQALPPTPVSVPLQQGPYHLHAPFCALPTPPAISGGLTPFSGCNIPSPQQGCGSNPLPPFQDIPPQIVSYREQMMSTPVVLSTPSPVPVTSAAGFQQFLDTASPAQGSPPTLSPTSSPAPVCGNDNTYWNITPTLPSTPVTIGQPILPSDFQNVSTSTSMQLVTSPGSETVYSAVPSPDTTTNIYPPYSYIDTPCNTPYPQFTS